MFIVRTALGTENGLSVTLSSLSSAGDFSSLVQRLRKGLLCPSHFSVSSSGIRYRFEIVQQYGYVQCIKSIHGKPIIFDKRWSKMYSAGFVTTYDLSSYKKSPAYLSNIQMDIVKIAQFFFFQNWWSLMNTKVKNPSMKYLATDDGVTVHMFNWTHNSNNPQPYVLQT